MGGERAFWWHCTQDDHGPRLSMENRPPVSRGEKEPGTPRLCVCKTLAGCFTGSLFYKRAPVYCYQTVTERRTNEPCKVWDALASGERWLVYPAELQLKLMILPAAVRRITAPTIYYHQQSKRPSSFRLKICQRMLAFQELGGPEWEGRLLGRWMKLIEVDDARQYILSAVHSGDGKRPVGDSR